METAEATITRLLALHEKEIITPKEREELNRMLAARYGFNTPIPEYRCLRCLKNKKQRGLAINHEYRAYCRLMQGEGQGCGQMLI